MPASAGGGDARGYAHPDYTASLAQFGVPTRLPRSSGWVLERAIPGEDAARDLLGPYPLFACRDWSGLREDLESLERPAVSVVVVADPLAGVPERELAQTFPDLVVAFKQHLVRDLEAPASLPAHHRRHIRRAARAVEVEVCADPPARLGDWEGLYEGLVARHGLVGIRAFSSDAFRKQLALPGTLAVRAERNGRTVGMTIWFESAPNAHYHLGAYSSEGYDVSASYALFQTALDNLRERGVHLVDLGAGPGGAGAPAQDGLLRFKRGWANADRPAHLCGRVLDRAAYARLAERRAVARSDWFPAYRGGERDLGGTVTEPLPGGVAG